MQYQVVSILQLVVQISSKYSPQQLPQHIQWTNRPSVTPGPRFLISYMSISFMIFRYKHLIKCVPIKTEVVRSGLKNFKAPNISENVWCLHLRRLRAKGNCQTACLHFIQWFLQLIILPLPLHHTLCPLILLHFLCLRSLP